MNTKPNIESIFLDAVDIESMEERRQFLRETCGDDSDLAREVERLLDAHDQGGTILDSLPFTDSSSDRDLIGHAIGATIGNYKLLQQIGEGGFGVVYMAEQFEPVQRKVALKIIKPGMDSKEVVARFEAERQALSLMDHPNIARVLDGGATKNGRPYFVMDLVRGVPLTEYCDEAQLDLDERLNLFIDVCRAVQHAHHKGVIHRDLKPSNVMVTLHDGRPVPRVIDFGVAKALNQRLTEKTLFTRYGQIIGTPAYMSPEQAEMSGLDIDTRSDVYSLGVLLYELLTSTTPFDGERLHTAGYAEMQRIIAEEEPVRPSTRLNTTRNNREMIARKRSSDLRKLTQSISGEIDWIVMKALEKDRNRRYESASSMASDVRRFLNDEQVEACPPTLTYRMSKMLRRNKTVIGLSGSALLLIVFVAVVCFLLAIKAKDAEKLAIGRLEASEQARSETESVSKFLIGMIEDSAPERRKRPVTAVGMLSAAEVKLIELDGQQALKAELQSTLARIYRSMGKYEDSIRLYEPSLEYLLALDQWPPETFSRIVHLSEVYRLAGRSDESVKFAERTLQASLSRHGAEHPETARLKRALGFALYSSGQVEDAVKAMTEALELWQQTHDETDVFIIETRDALAHAYEMAGHKKEALAMRKDAIAAYDEVFGSKLIAHLPHRMNHAYSLLKIGQSEQAIVRLEGIIAECQSTLGERHPVCREAKKRLHNAYLSTGRKDEAKRLLQELDAIKAGKP